MAKTMKAIIKGKMKKKIEVEIVALQFFCVGVSIDKICEALNLTYTQVENLIRERLNYLHSEK